MVNDTRVIAAELRGERHARTATSAKIAVNLIERIDPSRWRVLARPAKRLAIGDRVRFGPASDNACLVAGLDADVERRGRGRRGACSPSTSPARFWTRRSPPIGEMPLPPYIAQPPRRR